MRRFGPAPKTTQEILDAYVVPVPEAGCWLWVGPMFRNGYGCVSRSRKTITAHRLSYRHFKGEIPPGHFVCHTCDVKSCVNPAHLYAGLPAQNSRDAVVRGRIPRGTQVRHSKLTEDDVRAIRSSSLSASAMARQYGVAKRSVVKVRRHLSWAHVSDSAATADRERSE